MGLNRNNSKMIVVKSRGLVMTSRGQIMTPIRTPYRESVDTIWRMITQNRADVWEVLSNKTEVKLDVQNYDKDNTNPVVKKAEEKVKTPTTPAPAANIPNTQQGNNQINNHPSKWEKKKEKKNKYNEQNNKNNQGTFVKVDDSKPVEAVSKEPEKVEEVAEKVEELKAPVLEVSTEPTPEEKKETSEGLEVPVEEA